MILNFDQEIKFEALQKKNMQKQTWEKIHWIEKISIDFKWKFVFVLCLNIVGGGTV